jgi:hypothetical protein
VNYRILSVIFGCLTVGSIAACWQPVIAVETDEENIDCTDPDNCVEETIDCTDPDNCVLDDPRNPDTEIKILSPSANTELSTPTPSISWQTIDGATSYIIRVQDLEESEPMQEKTVHLPDVKVGEDGTLSIDFDYFFDQPLSPETEYQLIIETEIETMGEEKIIYGEVIFSISSQSEFSTNTNAAQ